MSNEEFWYDAHNPISLPETDHFSNAYQDQIAPLAPNALGLRDFTMSGYGAAQTDFQQTDYQRTSDAGRQNSVYQSVPSGYVPASLQYHAGSMNPHITSARPGTAPFPPSALFTAGPQDPWDRRSGLGGFPNSAQSYPQSLPPPPMLRDSDRTVRGLEMAPAFAPLNFGQPDRQDGHAARSYIERPTQTPNSSQRQRLFASDVQSAANALAKPDKDRIQLFKNAHEWRIYAASPLTREWEQLDYPGDYDYRVRSNHFDGVEDATKPHFEHVYIEAGRYEPQEIQYLAAESASAVKSVASRLRQSVESCEGSYPDTGHCYTFIKGPIPNLQRDSFRMPFAIKCYWISDKRTDAEGETEIQRLALNDQGRYEPQGTGTYMGPGARCIVSVDDVIDPLRIPPAPSPKPEPDDSVIKEEEMESDGW